MSPARQAQLTAGRLLARNVLWNLAGQLLPLVVGVAALRPIIEGLGIERFGLLSLAWIIVGYFSLFDLGLGRALTKLAADRFAQDPEAPIGEMARTGLALLVALGGLGTVVTWVLAGWLVRTALEVSAGLQEEAILSFYALATAIPVITVTSGLRGLLEARQHFTAANLIRLPSNVFMFVGPLLVLPFSRSLVPVVLTLVASRALAAVAYLVVCLRTFPSLLAGAAFDRSVVAPALHLGGWMTITNVVGPVMAYLDRFLIGMVLSVTAVAYYTAPFDVVTRFQIVPIAIVGVLFPAFTASLATDRLRASLLLSRGTKYVFLALLPVVLLAVALAPEVLGVWLGPAFAERSAAPLRWLAAGVLANSLAQVPFALLQAAGKPALTAALHLLELPVYLLGLFFLTREMGITGTAVAWALRAAGDAVVMFALAARLLPASRPFAWKLAAAATAAATWLLVGSHLTGLATKLLFVGGSVAAIAVTGWAVLSPEERAFLRAAAPGR